MKLAVIGVGHVGATTAFAVAQRGSANEVVLIDRDRRLAEAQARDITHAIPFGHACRVTAGDYRDLAGTDIAILAAGVNQRPGETRLALLERNAAVFAEIVPAVLRHCDPIFLVAANPVDIGTWITGRLAQRPLARIIGSGTILDTARFRALIAAHLGVAPRSVHAHVIGEHGDSEILCWSTATVSGIPVADVARQLRHPTGADIRRSIDEGVRRAAYAIIEGKGATWFGIAAGLARIVEAIAGDERAVMTVSACEDMVEGVPDVALSLPRLIGRSGLLQVLAPSIDEEERRGLRRSAELLREAIGALKPFT